AVEVRPLLIGLFFVIMTVTGVLISQLIAWFSDQGLDRKKLIIFANAMGAIGFIIFSFSRNYVVLLFSASVFISASSAALPQVFALAREILDKQNKPSMRFNSILRAQISLGWVIGPPIAFFIANHWGFQALFSLAAFMFVLLMLIVNFGIPTTPKASIEMSKPEIEDSLWRDKDIILLSLSFLLMYAGNNVYLISMPLYITQSLGFDPSLAGILMGTAAFIEIPIMLIVGNYATRLGKKPLILASVGAGVLFYIGVLINQSEIGFIALQVLNGTFIGVTAALGIAYFQDLKPSKMGQVTTLYSNAIKTGGILGSASAGVIADFSSLQHVFYAALVMVIVAFIAMYKVREA
ncbi:MAG: sugar efflux transporter, partial [Vibrio sp.]